MERISLHGQLSQLPLPLPCRAGPAFLCISPSPDASVPVSLVCSCQQKQEVLALSINECLWAEGVGREAAASSCRLVGQRCPEQGSGWQRPHRLVWGG